MTAFEKKCISQMSRLCPSNEYMENFSKLLQRNQELDDYCMGYARTIFDTIVEDLKNIPARDSIGVDTVYTIPKTPGMTQSKKSRRPKRFRISINSSVVSTSFQDPTETSEVKSTVNMTPNRTKGRPPGKKLRTDSTNTTQSSIQILGDCSTLSFQSSSRMTRMQTRALQNSLASINESTDRSSQTQSRVRIHTPNLKPKKVCITFPKTPIASLSNTTDDHDDDTPKCDDETAPMTAEDMATEVTSMATPEATILVTTPAKNLKSMFDNVTPPSAASHSDSTEGADKPAANSTMVGSCSTPVAPFKANLTIIESVATDAKGKKNRVVSSPSMPTRTSGRSSTEGKPIDPSEGAVNTKGGSQSRRRSSRSTPPAADVPRGAQLLQNQSFKPSPAPTPTPPVTHPELLSETCEVMSPSLSHLLTADDIAVTPQMDVMKTPGRAIPPLNTPKIESTFDEGRGGSLGAKEPRGKRLDGNQMSTETAEIEDDVPITSESDDEIEINSAPNEVEVSQEVEVDVKLEIETPGDAISGGICEHATIERQTVDEKEESDVEEKNESDVEEKEEPDVEEKKEPDDKKEICDVNEKEETEKENIKDVLGLLEGEKTPEQRVTRSRSKKLSEKESVTTPVPTKPPRAAKPSKDEEFHTPEQSPNQSLPRQGTVKKLVRKYESPQNASLEISKRQRISDGNEDGNAADESISINKKPKLNATDQPGSTNPSNLVSSVFSFVNKPTAIIKTAQELEAEKKLAARKKIEEKEAKCREIMNKKKERENEMRRKRLEKERRMKQAKEAKLEEEKRKKAELEKKMKAKEEASVKERELAARKEEEKRQRELRKAEMAERRRKAVEKEREEKKRKIQEEAAERKQEALRRKQELEEIKVKELEKKRLEEEHRLEEQRRAEADALQKKQKAEEERRKISDERKRAKTPIKTPTMGRKHNPALGELLQQPPSPKPPPRTLKQATSKIPIKSAIKTTTESTKSMKTIFPNNAATAESSEKIPILKLEQALSHHNLPKFKHYTKLELKQTKFPKKVTPDSTLSSTTSSCNTTMTSLNSSRDMFSTICSSDMDVAPASSLLATPLHDVQVASPTSASRENLQSYMKSKLLSLGSKNSKLKFNKKLEQIEEDDVKQPTLKFDPRDNYRIDDLASDEETDEDTKPKRTIPAWARDRKVLHEKVAKQFNGPGAKDYREIFAPYPMTVNLDDIFNTVDKYKSRTSSAQWTTVPQPHGELDFSILTEDEILHANRLARINSRP